MKKIVAAGMSFGLISTTVLIPFGIMIEMPSFSPNETTVPPLPTNNQEYKHPAY